MPKEEGYQGWPNYETWNVALWIDNEINSYNYWREKAQEAVDDAKGDRNFTKKERAVVILSDMLKNEFEEAEEAFLEKAEASGTMWADLIGAALGEVHWRKIAETILENMESVK